MYTESRPSQYFSKILNNVCKRHCAEIFTDLEFCT